MSGDSPGRTSVRKVRSLLLLLGGMHPYTSGLEPELLEALSYRERCLCDIAWVLLTDSGYNLI